MLLGHSSLSGARGRVAHDSWSWLGLASFFSGCAPARMLALGQLPAHRVCSLGTDERTNMACEQATLLESALFAPSGTTEHEVEPR